MRLIIAHVMGETDDDIVKGLAKLSHDIAVNGHGTCYSGVAEGMAYVYEYDIVNVSGMGDIWENIREAKEREWS